MFVKPADGLTVREPGSMRILPPEGREVPENGFWMRRLRDGDVVRHETEEERKVREAAEAARKAEAEPEADAKREPDAESAPPAPAAETE